MPVGTIVVPKASIAITRNYDFDFIKGDSSELPYRISKPVSFLGLPGNLVLTTTQVNADPELHRTVRIVPFAQPTLC